MHRLRRAVSVVTLLSVLATSIPVLAADDAQILGFGGLGIAGGALLVAGTTSPERDCTLSFSTSGPSSESCEEDRSFQNGMFIVAGVGAVVSILGFIIVASNGNTVTVDGKTVARSNRPSVALTPRGIAF